MSAEEGADQPPQQEQQPQQQESQKSGGGGDGGLSMVGKILAFVSIGLVLVGYIIADGAYSSPYDPNYYYYLVPGEFFGALTTLLIFTAPVLLLYLALAGDGGEVIKAVCAFCSSALALWVFFVFVTFARYKDSNSRVRGFTSGLFFTFIGEVVCAVAVFVFA